MSIGEELSIQLYSLREFGDLQRQLAALAELGYRRVETIGVHLAEAEAVRAALDAHGMSAPTGHVGLDDLRDRFDWVVDQAAALGVEALFMPAVPQEDRRGRDARFWHGLGAELGDLAERLSPHDLRLGYHNHDWELEPFEDGSTPLAVLFAGAAGSPLTFQADLAWLARGGADPVAWMDAHRDRLSAIHVKDVAPEGDNLVEEGWAPIGEGTLDWPRLFQQAKSRGAQWFILEHDRPADPIRFARTGRIFALDHFR